LYLSLDGFVVIQLFTVSSVAKKEEGIEYTGIRKQRHLHSLDSISFATI
jgi:hypothetical protein